MFISRIHKDTVLGNDLSVCILTKPVSTQELILDKGHKQSGRTRHQTRDVVIEVLGNRA